MIFFLLLPIVFAHSTPDPEVQRGLQAAAYHVDSKFYHDSTAQLTL